MGGRWGDEWVGVSKWEREGSGFNGEGKGESS